MTGCDKSLMEKISLSEVKLGRRSPLSEKLHIQLIQQFKTRNTH